MNDKIDDQTQPSMYFYVISLLKAYCDFDKFVPTYHKLFKYNVPRIYAKLL